MQTILGAAGMTSAIVGSVALALWLEWLSLRGLMHLMPAPVLSALSEKHVAPPFQDGMPTKAAATTASDS